jgi:hypothetical protein
MRWEQEFENGIERWRLIDRTFGQLAILSLRGRAKTWTLQVGTGGHRPTTDIVGTRGVALSEAAVFIAKQLGELPARLFTVEEREVL